MYDRNLNKTLDWLKHMLKIIDGSIKHISMFILSKTLNSYYKNPQSIPHKVLALELVKQIQVINLKQNEEYYRIC